FCLFVLKSRAKFCFFSCGEPRDCLILLYEYAENPPPNAPPRRPHHAPGWAARAPPPLRQPQLRLSSRSGSPPRPPPLYHLDREGSQPLAVRPSRSRPAGLPGSCRLDRVLGKRRPPGGC